MGSLGNEAADVLANQAAEGVPLDDHDKWMTAGGASGSEWEKRRRRENVEEEGDMKRVMRWKRKA